jgi:hypothetical protein
MQKNNGKFSMEDAQRLAASPQAKQLQELIQNTDRARMEVAARQAAAGNYTELQQTLAPLLNDPRVRDLLKQLGG